MDAKISAELDKLLNTTMERVSQRSMLAGRIRGRLEVIQMLGDFSARHDCRLIEFTLCEHFILMLHEQAKQLQAELEGGDTNDSK